jgi:6-phosphogluconolactonase (cycloisomerase 2 family)
MLRHATVCVGLCLLSTANARADSHESKPGAVFTLSNEAEADHVLAFARDEHGLLSAPEAFATEGRGSGDALGSQGALVLTEDHRFLLAVDAGSAEISVFAVDGPQLELRSHIASGGQRPISLTEHCNTVFVLNAGGDANVTGFRLDSDGMLQPIAASTAALPGGQATGPAQVQLSDDGRALIVSEKAQNRLVSYHVGSDGHLSDARFTASEGTTAFGFDISRNGYVVVSEAASGSASSYAIAHSGALAPVSSVVSDHQKAPCWVVLSPDDRYAFVANAGSASISAYSLGEDGALQLLDEQAGPLDAEGHPLDLAISAGHYLYALDRGRQVVSFMLDHAGALTPVGMAAGVTEFAAGLAAY